MLAKIQVHTLFVIALLAGCSSNTSRQEEQVGSDGRPGSTVRAQSPAQAPAVPGSAGDSTRPRRSSATSSESTVNEKTGTEPNGVPATGPALTAPRYAPAGPQEPLPQVFFEPVDMTSAVGESPLKVSVHVNQGGTVSDSVLANLANQVSLVEWPGMTELPATKQVARMPDGLAVAAAVTVVPSRPLGDRWYALKVASLPSGFVWPAFAAHRVMAGGTIVSRFRIGSDPQVASIRTCDKDGQALLIVDFSERVAIADRSLVTARYQTGKAPACQDWEPVGPDGAMSMSRLCSALDDSQALDIVVRPGAMRTAAPSMTPLRVNLKGMVAWGEGCRIFRP